MTSVFIDTVGMVALWDEDDQWHDAADAAWRTVLASNALPYTTTFVLAECGNAAARRPYRAQVELLQVQFERARRLIRPPKRIGNKPGRITRAEKPGMPVSSITCHFS